MDDTQQINSETTEGNLVNSPKQEASRLFSEEAFANMPIDGQSNIHKLHSEKQDSSGLLKPKILDRKKESENTLRPDQDGYLEFTPLQKFEMDEFGKSNPNIAKPVKPGDVIEGIKPNELLPYPDGPSKITPDSMLKQPEVHTKPFANKLEEPGKLDHGITDPNRIKPFKPGDVIEGMKPNELLPYPDGPSKITPDIISPNQRLPYKFGPTNKLKDGSHKSDRDFGSKLKQFLKMMK